MTCEAVPVLYDMIDTLRALRGLIFGLIDIAL
jgi:hypothetical protein